MRIVAGKYRGRRIAAPPGRDTRPTSDRVREAIFSVVYSSIGDLDGICALDLYAGSGALGLEALSRGASTCTFVESDRWAAGVINENLLSLGLGEGACKVLRMPVERLSPGVLDASPVSLLLADPPYRIDATEFSGVVAGLASRGALSPGAMVVYEHAARTKAVWPTGFKECAERRYGDTAVSFAVYEG
ncbi:MAG: 16S rRNA (guanine(966)-N(2))-methyltransferase RsmD [Coriobacteriia bacterium]|nr:16S rRNA (guanine(966)-N(2))-methyltransferase RsmD [Coriobacteriia bacterium]